MTAHPDNSPRARLLSRRWFLGVVALAGAGVHRALARQAPVRPTSGVRSEHTPLDGLSVDDRRRYGALFDRGSNLAG